MAVQPEILKLDIQTINLAYTHTLHIHIGYDSQPWTMTVCTVHKLVLTAKFLCMLMQKGNEDK